jgi:hypothetical protein
MPFTFLAAIAVAAWARVRGYEVLATTEAQSEREAVCDVCEFFDGEQCLVCGCLVQAKTALNTEQCPKKKWSRIWIARKRQK